MNFCLGHNFQSIEGSNFKLHTQIDHIKDSAVYKNHNSIPSNLELLPFVIFNLGFLSGA